MIFFDKRNVFFAILVCSQTLFAQTVQQPQGNAQLQQPPQSYPQQFRSQQFQPLAQQAMRQPYPYNPGQYRNNSGRNFNMNNNDMPWNNQNMPWKRDSRGNRFYDSFPRTQGNMPWSNRYRGENTPWGRMPWSQNRGNNSMMGNMPWNNYNDNFYGNMPWSDQYAGARTNNLPWSQRNNNYLGHKLPWNQTEFMPWNNNGRNSPWSSMGNTPMGNMSGPWNGNSNIIAGPWKNGFDKSVWGGSGPESWFQPQDPKGSIERSWDDFINTPSGFGRMPGGWKAPTLRFPNPTEVTDKFGELAEEIPDEMRNQADNIEFQ